MRIKKAFKGERVQLKLTNQVVGIALHNIEEEEVATYEHGIMFPVDINGFLKLLPGVKKN